MQRRHPVGQEAFRRARQLLRAKASSVHHGVEPYRFGVRPAKMRLPPACVCASKRHQSFNPCIKGDSAAVILQIAAQREHEAVAVDDPGLG